MVNITPDFFAFSTSDWLRLLEIRPSEDWLSDKCLSDECRSNECRGAVVVVPSVGEFFSQTSFLPQAHHLLDVTRVLWGKDFICSYAFDASLEWRFKGWKKQFHFFILPQLDLALGASLGISVYICVITTPAIQPSFLTAYFW